MNKSSKIVISGATGFLGKLIVSAISSKGYAICVLSRNSQKARKILGEKYQYVNWNGEKSNELQAAINGSKAVIHLAGANVAGARWSVSYKNEIMESRIQGTSAIAHSISCAVSPPEVWFSASAIGYYGNEGDEIKRENSPSNTDFLATVCKEWELATSPAENYCRVVRGRIGVVLDKHEGALAKMLIPFRLGVGGRLGSGRQWLSWVHTADVVGMILWAIENNSVQGAMNIVSPNPLQMKEFANVLGKVLGRPSWFPVPEFILKLVLGEQAWIVITGQRVEPEVAQRLGYNFQFNKLNDALKNLLA